MKKILIILIFIISKNSFSQSLEFSGKVKSDLLNETGRIYYTSNSKPFNPKKFITYDNNKVFKFKITIEEIKKQNIEFLAFALDTTQNIDNQHACVHRIEIKEIISSSEFKNLKNIKLYTDLLLDVNCEETVYYDAKMENQDRFVGRYSLVLNDTLRTIQLDNVLFRYKSQIDKAINNYMNEEFGSWSYDADKKTLTFHIRRQTNNKYGLAISKYYKFEFIVDETSNGVTFQSTNGILTKR